MYHDVVEVRCANHFTLELTFDDGQTGRMDCRSLMDRGGVFDRLRDPDVFRRVRVNRELGVVTWDDEIDIAPETAYSIATGSPLPEWARGYPATGDLIAEKFTAKDRKKGKQNERSARLACGASVVAEAQSTIGMATKRAIKTTGGKNGDG